MRRIVIWRQGKDGFERTTAQLYERQEGTEVVYDEQYRLPEKVYRSRCDVCLVQEQGYGCDKLIDNPGPYEYEGGCMDCKHMCGKPPIHAGVRSYCADHMYILKKRLERS